MIAPSVTRPLSAVDDCQIIDAATVSATKVVVATDPYLSGHYPGRPIYPGVFILESVRQAVEHLISERASACLSAQVESLESARFHRPLLAGAELQLRAACTSIDRNRLSVKASCTLGETGELAAQLTLTVRIVKTVT